MRRLVATTAPVLPPEHTRWSTFTNPTPYIAFFETPAGDRVPIRGNCSIGRSQANEIVLADDRVSRRHAIVHVQGATECWLVDRYSLP